MAVEINIPQTIQEVKKRIGSKLPDFRSILKRQPQQITPDTESEEIVDPFKTLVNLQDKAVIMEDMIDHDQIKQEPNSVMRFKVRLWFRSVFKDKGIEGLDKLQEAITKARITGKRLVFTPPHLSDADHPAAIYLFGRKKRGLGIQDELVWMSGINMYKRPDIKKFMGAERVINNVTPRDMEHLHLLEEGKSENGFGERQAKILEEVKLTFSRMRRRAAAKVLEVCVRQKKPLVIYIEGGRSYNGKLKPPLEDFKAFFPDDENVTIVPYRVYGAREFNPPGRLVGGVLRRELFLPWLRHPVRMVVGDPYPSSEIWEVYRQRLIEGESDAKPLDWVMANIANLDWAYVRAEDQPRHLRLMERFAPGRLRRPVQEAA